VRRYPATVFVVLVFAISWSVWVPRALVSEGLLSTRWPIALGAYWTYMPAVAAVITAALVGGVRSVNSERGWSAGECGGGGI
jgi:uncharacterized protein